MIEIVEKIVRGRGGGGRIKREEGGVRRAKHFNGGKGEGKPISGRSHVIVNISDECEKLMKEWKEGDLK